MTHKITTGRGKYIHHAQNRIGGVRTVQGCQDQMPRFRKTQCQFNTCQITQFTEQYHIRIATQNITQSTFVIGKMRPQFTLMYQTLTLRKFILNRIFNRHEVCGMLHLSGIEPTGKRRRFTTARGSCDQNQTFGKRRELAQKFRLPQCLWRGW